MLLFVYPFCSVSQEALLLYRQRRIANPADTQAVLGCMRCLDSLGEWENLVELCNESWDTLTLPSVDPAVHRKAATLAAR